jgi:DNA-binding response OmpR family regulator
MSDAFPSADIYVLAAVDYLEREPDRRPFPAIVWGGLDLVAECLARGALDGLAVPIDPLELSARLRGRSAALASSLSTELSTELRLDARENRFLALLFLAGPSGLSRSALTWALWGKDLPSSRRLDVLVSGLRKKLRSSERGKTIEIKAFRGMGYALKSDPVDNL